MTRSPVLLRASPSRRVLLSVLPTDSGAGPGAPAEKLGGRSRLSFRFREGSKVGKWGLKPSSSQQIVLSRLTAR